jgi:carbon-monoxide dehydrogenase small subunit
MRIRVQVNGDGFEHEVEPRTLLSDFIRHQAGLTGTHVGCEHGVCGACTVLFDGEPIRSCLMLAVQADGHSLETVEGLAGPDGELSVLQRSFSEHHALQCGFCTAGFLMSAQALLRRRPAPTEREVREELAGNLCRCTGYEGIVAAVLAASGASGGQSDRPSAG